jgi:fibronectin type 3 domain-containing protein
LQDPWRGISLITGCLAVATTLAAVGGASAAAPGGMLVGFAEDLPKEIGAAAVAPATDLGARAFRITLIWSPGQTQLLDADAAKLDRATAATAGLRLVLAVYANAGSKAPVDATGRDAYCAYVRNVLSRYAAIRDVAIWNEPNKSLFWNPQTDAAGLYEALLARCWNVLHGSFSNVNVIGLTLSSSGNDNATSTSPGAFVRSVGDAYRASGRGKPILDTVGYHAYPLDPAERPWRKHIQSKVLALGDWNKLMYNLWLAFNGTAQPIPGQAGVSIWYLEVGFQTRVDPAHAGAYSGTENVAALPDDAGSEPDSPPPAETSAAPDQSTQILDSVRLAACQPFVGGFFNFLLFDEPVLTGWQSGAYWADRTPKDSLAAFRRAIGEVNSGTVNCEALKGGPPSGDFMPPSVPQNLLATPQEAPLRVELAWDAATDDASALAYRVYRNGAFVATTTATSWTHTNPAEGTTYTYSVRAIDSAGNLGDASAPVSATTPDQSAPTPPPDLAAQALVNPARVELSWTAATDPAGVAGYEVSRDGAVIGTSPTPSFTDAGVSGSTTYVYSVIAYDAAGNRSDPAAVQVTTPEAVPPSAPTGLNAVVRSGPVRVQLGWNAATDDTGVTGYRVYRNGSAIATATSTAYLDAAVKPSTKYRYFVTALDQAGNESPASATVSVKTEKK